MMSFQKFFGILLIIVSIIYYWYTSWIHSFSNYYNNLWNIEYEDNFFTWALQNYQKSLRFTPNDPVILFNLWQVYYNLWDYESSLEYIDKSYENYSKMTFGSDLRMNEIIEFKMRNYFQLAQLDKLEKLVNETLNKNQNHLIANYYKAELLFHEAEYISALGYIDRYLEIEPDDNESLYLKGDILYYYGDFKQAVKYFVQSNNYYSAGFSSFYSYDFSSAIQYFDLSIQQNYWDSIDSEIEDRNEDLYRAISYYFNKDYQSWVDIFQEIIKQDYSEDKYEVIPFYTLSQYHLWEIDQQWLKFVEDKLDVDELIENESKIQKLFIEKSYSEYTDFLYQNYIYSGK